MGTDSSGILFTLANAFPPIRKLMEALNMPTFNEPLSGLMDFAKQTSKEHEATFQEDSQRDFVDRYIKKRYDEASNPSSSFHGQDGRFQMESFIMDIMLAGSQTTSITLNWFFLYM